MGGSLLFGLFLQLLIAKQHIDRQPDSPHRDTDVGHIEHGKVHKQSAEHIGDITEGNAVDKVA